MKSAVLIVGLHAIYSHGRWYGPGRAGQEAFYEEHLRSAPAIAEEIGCDTIVVSGGYTRTDLPEDKQGLVVTSEADGAIEFIRDAGVDLRGRELVPDRFARDSLENLHLGVLAARRACGEWPEAIGFLSFSFKLLRMYASALGLGVADRFEFVPSGGMGGREYESVICGELRNLKDAVLPDMRDPLLRGESFRVKRAERTPAGLSEEEYQARVKEAYAPNAADPVDQSIRRWLDEIAALQPGQGWRDLQPPWATAP